MIVLAMLLLSGIVFVALHDLSSRVKAGAILALSVILLYVLAYIGITHHV